MVLTANDHFKLQYPRYMRWATLLALLVTILVFMLTPRYEPEPYRLRHREIILIPPPQPEVILERPEDIPAPPRPVLPVDDDIVLEEPELPSTLISPPWPLPEPVQAKTSWGEPGFVASAANPVAIYIAPPHYPEMARLLRLEGTVMVNVLVGVDGTVQAVELQQGAHPILDRAALTAARKCTFKPGVQRTRPVAVWLAIPYRFTIR
jgi:protein TonB